MSFIYTTAISKIRKLNKRYRVVQGGTSASKTYSIIAILIDYAARNDNKKIDVVGITYDQLAGGAIQDFQDIMKDTNRWRQEGWNDTKHKYTFVNGSFIRFKSMDKPSKAKGPRRDVLYVNEANHIDYQVFNNLTIRTNEHIFIDFNPDSRFWVHEEIIGEDDSDFIILTYKDNEALSEQIIKDFDKKREWALTNSYWANWCKVYIDGEIGSLEGTIYQNWTTIDSIPDDAKLVGIGLDFGYSNDQTGAVAIYKYNGKLILDELIYETGLDNPKIAKILIDKGFKSAVVVCDSSEPKSIYELNSYGLKALGATKGPDSIMHGIQLMQQQELLVTSRSSNIINELQNYIWMKDGNGMSINKPRDLYNHLCFVGETLITTNRGLIQIKDIISNEDYVLTSKGFKKVLRKLNNGYKQVQKYCLQFDTFCVYLISTDNHLIKTTEGWKEISKLKKEDVIFLHKNSMGKHFIYTQDKDIIQEDAQECTELYGNTSMEKYQKDATFIMSTKMPQTIELKTLNLLKEESIYHNIQKIDSKIIQNGLKDFGMQELNQQKIGINLKKELNGIDNMQSGVDLEQENLNQKNVNSVNQYLYQNHHTQDFVQIIVNQHGEEQVEQITKQESVNIAEKNLHATNICQQKLVDVNVEENYNEYVYDLEVDECHEYFANGILVHNCDASRYLVQTLLQQSNYKFRAIRK